MDTNFYKDLIFKCIASQLNLDSESLRWFSTIQFMPNKDSELFTLFDIIPGICTIFEGNEHTHHLCSTYEKLLLSQKQELITDIAKKNFENKKYYLEDDDNTPKYKPSFTEIANRLPTSSSLECRFHSSEYPFTPSVLSPSFLNSVADQPSLMFNQIAVGEEFEFILCFQKIAHIPVRAEGWFTQGFFTKAFKNPQDWMTGSNTITWDSLFGKDGILKFISNGVLVASGMELTIHSFGEYDGAMFNALNSIKETTSIWPFYLNGDSVTQDYELCPDKSIKIKITTPPSQILLLAIQAGEISSLYPEG